MTGPANRCPPLQSTGVYFNLFDYDFARDSCLCRTAKAGLDCVFIRCGIVARRTNPSHAPDVDAQT